MLAHYFVGGGCSRKGVFFETVAAFLQMIDATANLARRLLWQMRSGSLGQFIGALNDARQFVNEFVQRAILGDQLFIINFHKCRRLAAAVRFPQRPWFSYILNPILRDCKWGLDDSVFRVTFT